MSLGRGETDPHGPPGHVDPHPASYMVVPAGVHGVVVVPGCRGVGTGVVVGTPAPCLACPAPPCSLPGPAPWPVLVSWRVSWRGVVVSWRVSWRGVRPARPRRSTLRGT